ncbi:MAG: L-lactate permease [Actinomycetaceae bacterium]|nr:L-lactate permease [Actinomycetaceae bacterium]
MLATTTFTAGSHLIGDSLFLSAMAGLLPLVVFFVLLGVFGVKTHWCAIISLGVSLVVAVLGFQMPLTYALLAGTQGAGLGFMPILYIIIAAVWLYNLTERSGRAADVRTAFNLVGKGDQRVLALLIGFSFCGLLEGLAGFGAPVAIVAAILVTVGFDPIKAAMITIVGNAINVGYGAMAIPVTSAAKSVDLEPTVVASWMGHITPIIAAFIPMILLLIADGVRGLKQLWPAALLVGAVTAGGHYWATNFFSYELTAVISSLLGFASIALLMQIWTPTTPAEVQADQAQGLTLSRATLALMPYWLVVIVFGIAKLWTLGVDLPALLKTTDVKFGWPGLHGNLVNAAGEPIAGTNFTVQTLGSPGTLIVLTAVIVSLVYGLTSSGGKFPFTFGQGLRLLFTTIYNLRIAILTIATIMALAFVMNFSGQTGTIGLWMAGVGTTFVFISPVLGWIGTAVTGSATSAGALFANLQYTAAGQIGADPNLLVGTNAVGGGLGKIVSPQNLAIAVGAIGKEGAEPELLRKAGPISIGLLVVLCLLVGSASLLFPPVP